MSGKSCNFHLSSHGDQRARDQLRGRMQPGRMDGVVLTETQVSLPQCGKAAMPPPGSLSGPAGHTFLHLGVQPQGLLRKFYMSLGICDKAPSSVSLFPHPAWVSLLHLRSEGPVSSCLSRTFCLAGRGVARRCDQEVWPGV